MEMKGLIYLDNAATTPIDEKVLEKMLPYFRGEYGNPSSIYKSGRKAKQVIEHARQGLADVIGAKSSEVIFTGSGTEANNLAILGVARANKKYGNHILVSTIEHKSVLESVKQLEKEGFIIEYIPVDNYGVIDVDEIMKLITDKTILISVMYANNEIGTIQPIQELSKRVSEFKNQEPRTINYPLVHTDACQVAGQLSIDVRKLGVDLMTLNGGKIYGPKGIGVLYKKENINIEPIIFGGGQESGLRGGTESVPLIVGMLEALCMVDKNREIESVRLTELRNYLIVKLKEIIGDVVLNGHPTNRLPNNVHISIPKIEGEAVVLMLDEMSVQVSTGSACSSKDLEVSHVLKAINQSPEIIHGSIRFSLGKETRKDDIDYVMGVLGDIVKRLKSMSSLTINI